MSDVFVSGFSDRLSDCPGGIWRLDGHRLVQLHSGLGVFGLCWSEPHRILLGVTRSDDLPIVVFRADDGRGYLPVRVEYRDYIPSYRTHGAYIYGDTLFVVATQGDPDAVACTNDDFVDHRVGKVIISKVDVRDDHVLIRDSYVWNPYECDHHHHYNDLVVDERFIYLASFSTCDRHRRYIGRGAVTRFSRGLSDPTIMMDDLESPHSPQIFDGRLYACSSSTSSIMSVRLDADSPKPTLEFKTLNNFIRGLTVAPDVLLIGLSRSAGRTRSAHLTEAINGVLQFNRQNGATVKIDVPDGCDNVYAITCAGELGQGRH